MRQHTIVLLPGLDGTGECFLPFCRILPEQFTPVVVRYPTDTEMTYDEAADYAARLLPAGERIILLGESYSGPVALRLAVRNPEKIEALVLCSTFVTPPFSKLLRALCAVLPLSFLFRHPPRLLLRYFLVGMDAPREYTDRIIASLRMSGSSVLASRVRNVAYIDVRRELAECRVPMLYIHASGDRVVYKTKLEEMLGVRPDIATVHIPGPHQILQRQPQLALEAIREFLAANGLDEK